MSLLTSHSPPPRPHTLCVITEPGQVKKELSEIFLINVGVRTCTLYNVQYIRERVLIEGAAVVDAAST